ncbi:ABC transporter related protein [Denitrovibrio acetiphilus DSM 12809]|uniref:ABC transporter related protein n=1 Tax=Denitrovibrio acetiphilus (strain DSM 12809 / NBRC 114555 / N2460) TaxID=522772 RepID=D4H6N7_DENA2|nr:dipeptide ABC transporter ATP-binding protein [Denitrovibrio acetiphilus]ADD67753.1 ABC transporter related protein [Denitrovibrio acetiphilus DSM 12809]
MENILEIKNLNIVFEMENHVVEAVRDFSFEVRRGEIFALVGESGSGKSVCAHTITGLMSSQGAKIRRGSIKLNSRELSGLINDDMRKIRGGEIAYIFQEPMVSLNPLHTVIRQVTERMRVIDKMPEKKARQKALGLLHEVGIRDIASRLSQYPHQFSGGERQRVMIAMALAGEPSLLVADEPTTALDVTVQKQILELLKKLNKERNMSVLLITHDLGIVREYAHRVAVVKDGLMVETAETEKLFSDPQTKYARELLSDVDIAYACPPDSLEPVLDIRNLNVRYTGKGIKGRYDVHAVKGASFVLNQGASVGIVGESGSGKSSLARGILRLTDAHGEALYKGVDLMKLSAGDMRSYRRHVQIVFQDPFGSLNPRMTAGMIVAEGLKASGMKDKEQIRKKVLKAFDDVNLDREMFNRYPHEFSGGQRQRIAIARAVVMEPEVIFLDEATSSLDKVVQNQVIELLAEIQNRYGISYVFISHDLSVVKSICDEVLVMKDGEIVEMGQTEKILSTPENAYTKQLIEASYL